MSRPKLLTLCCWALILLALMARTDAQAPAPTALDKVLSALNAEKPDEREAGLEKLTEMMRSDGRIKARADVHIAVAGLVVREAGAIRSWSLQARRGEEYDGEFYSGEVLPAAMDLLNDVTPESEPVLIAALVESVYGTGSRVSEVLAGVGEPAMPAIIRLTTAADSSQRSKAYDLLGLTLAKQRAGNLRKPLSASSFAEARRLLANGLGDRDTVARRNAVRAVTKAQDRGAIPKLKVLAATDPDSGQAGFEWNSVRGLAAAALKVLAREP